MKACNKCGWFGSLDHFHLDKRTKDGHVTICKRCARAKARACRDRNVEYWRAHDRARARTADRKAQDLEALRRKRENKPIRSKAHQAVSTALDNGTLVKGPCEVCGSTIRIHGHHDDYSKPLDVRWLCVKHHVEHHRKELAAQREAKEREEFA